MDRRIVSLGREDGRSERGGEGQRGPTASEMLTFASAMLALAGVGVIWLALCASLAWRLAQWVA